MDYGKNIIKTLSGINLLAALWILISPFMLGLLGTNFALIAYTTGIILLIVSLVRVTLPERSAWMSWVNAILGFWLLISPFAISGLKMTAIWNNIIIGLIVIVVAVWSYSVATISSNIRAQ